MTFNQSVSEMRKDIWEELIKAIAANPQGMLLFLLGSAVVTLIQLAYRKEVIRGYKGANGFMESQEWTMYVFSWVWPEIVMGAATGVMNPQDWVWYFLLIMMAYGLTGNKGVEAILAWRGIGGTTKSETTTSTTVTASQSTKQEPPQQ